MKQDNTCIEPLVQQEMQKLCNKFNIPFSKTYYEQNRDLYTTYIIGKLQQKTIANKIIETFKNGYHRVPPGTTTNT